DQAWPGDRRVRDAPRLPHEEDGFAAIEDRSRLEVEVAGEDRAASFEGAAREREARATEERRMLEREGDVVERLQEHEAVVRGEEVRERIGRKGARLRGDFSAPGLWHALVHVAKLEPRDVHDEPAQRRDRHVVAK